MSYPTTILANTDPVGTSLLAVIDHAAQHSTVNDDLTQVENKLGLGAGSASANTLLVGSGAGSAVWGTTWNNGNLGTPTLTGGTSTGLLSNNPTLGSPSITGGTQLGYQSTYLTLGSVALSPGTSTTGTLVLNTASRFLINMPSSAGSVTLAVSNASPNQPFIVEVLQGAAGAGTINWFSTINWLNSGTSAPAQGTTAGRKNTYGFITTSSSTYDGYIVGKGE